MFADELDRAAEYEFFETQERIRLAASQSSKKRLPVVPGLCDVCEKATETDAHLFCSPACRAEDEKHERLLSIRGRPS